LYDFFLQIIVIGTFVFNVRSRVYLLFLHSLGKRLAPQW